MTQQTLTKHGSAIDNIDAMLNRVGNAQAKAAAANTEAGGFQGESTHPVTQVDDRTSDAQEGARSSENTSDVKEDQGTPAVDATSPGTPGGQDSAQLNIGTNQSATGEDSTVETESAKGGKDDPGTQRGSTGHPARTDNDSLEGGKYANARDVLQKVAAAQEAGNTFLADLATAANSDVQAKAAELQSKQATPTTAGDPSGNSATPDSEPTAAHPPGKGKGGGKSNVSEDKEAAEAGYDLAAAFAAGGMVDGPQKVAQDQMVVTALEDTVQTAFDMAEKTAEYIHSFNAEKKALEEEENGEGGEEDPANPPEAAGEDEGREAPSTPAEAPMGEGGGDEEAALLEALTGGGDMGGGDIGGEQAIQSMGGGEAPMGAEGGMPPMGGGPPMGAEGGMPPMGGGPPMGAEGGMPPMGAEGGMPPLGAEGGMPPMGGGMPMGAEGGMPMGAEGGMPPMGAEGGMPPEGGGGLGGISEEDLAMLLAALQQEGIAPEQFEAKAAAHAAKQLTQKQASNKPLTDWKPKTAAEAQQLQRLIGYVREVAAS